MKSAKNNDEYSSIAEVDAIFLPAGDPAGDDEPVRKRVAFQVSPTSSAFELLFLTYPLPLPKTWLLGWEFPSTLLLFQKDKFHVVCSPSKGKLLPIASTLAI